MSDIWSILIEFLFRLTSGMALAMAITPARWVSSGFFRVHLWVLMGIQTFAALALYSRREMYAPWGEGTGWQLAGVAALAATISYVGAVLWMYDALRAGKIAIVLVALLAAIGSFGLAWPAATTTAARSTGIHLWLQGLDGLPGSLLLGGVVTAMLLGHWYLNSPGMKMEPLQRLLIFLAGALILRTFWSAGTLLAELQTRSAAEQTLQTSFLLFLVLRWLAGIVGPAGMTFLTWQTLKIPNTQSATGILYAAVILVFIGELTARLMSATSTFPL